MSPHIQSELKLGRFEILRELGQGAFGTVYLARDPQLERSVALKVPNLRFKARPSHAERFLQEARAAAGLHHPNIVPIHDAGQLGDQYYIAAAFIEGGTLRDIMRSSGKPSPATAARLIANLADALGYAHEKGVIHRDVKPENVLLDAQGTPYLTDFGLARRLQDEVNSDKKSLFGTPSYMSPEQASGHGAVADGHSDQWALGVILYELLTDRRPFEGDPLNVLYAIQHAEPAPLRSLVPALPLDLEAICLKCLSKPVEQRYANCYELARDLERWLADEPVAARPLTLLQRASRWSRREPLLARLASSFVIVITAFSMLLTMLWISAEQNRIDAEIKEEETSRLNELLTLQTQAATAATGELEKAAKIREITVQELEKSKQELQQSNAKLTLSEATLQKKLQELNESQALTAQAQRATASEQSKNSKLRYLGDILAIGFAVASGQHDRALSMLEQTQPTERSLEWSFLKKLAQSRNTQYQLIDDFEQLAKNRSLTVPSLHFPEMATQREHTQALMNSPAIKAVGRDAKRWLTATATSDALRPFLPEGIYQTRDPQYPNGPVLNMFTFVATEFGEKAILAREQASHAWLSPDGRWACFMTPKIDQRTVDADDIVITIRFELILIDLDASSPERWKLVQPADSYIDLPIRIVNIPGAGRGYTLKIPNMQLHFDGAFSPDSTSFVLFDAQNRQLNRWTLAESSSTERLRQPTATMNLNNQISQPVAASASRFSGTEFQLSVLGKLIACDGRTLDVVRTVELPTEEATLEAIVFSRSGQHLAQLFSLSDFRGGVSLRIGVYNFISGSSSKLTVTPQQLANCSNFYAFSRTPEGRLLEAGRAGLLTIDWMGADFVDDIDGQWLSFRIRPHAQLYFEKPRTTNELTHVLWHNPNKQTPVVLNAQVSNNQSADQLLIGYPNRVVILQRRLDSDWEVKTSHDLAGGELIDGLFHPSQNSLLLGQHKNVTILGLANSKPKQFPLPLERSLCLLSDRILGFVNSAGQVQLASAVDGTLITAHGIDRLGSTCLTADLKNSLLAVGSTERKLTVFNLVDQRVVKVETTREPPKSLSIARSGKTLCMVGQNGHVAIYSWPGLVRQSALMINDEILLATPSNDGKRVLLVTPNEFQIIDSEYGVRILDGQKFPTPLVAATVSADQSEIFVYNRNGQLLSFKL